ncbi:MAG TPA: hypothetical protein VFJ07_04850 [Streptosporangiaceae bacterium]|nr:hypothetical protein [Streptosporangiaceae bacterium]
MNQDGVAGNYPAPDAGDAQEISLDLDMVSAICPKCHGNVGHPGVAITFSSGDGAYAGGVQYPSSSPYVT